MRAAGRVVSRDELMLAVCRREASPFDRSLDVHISHLRRKLEAQRALIRTVRGVGYLFCREAEATPRVSPKTCAIASRSCGLGVHRPSAIASTRPSSSPHFAAS